MTDLQSFIDKYINTYVEIAGSPNAINQCVDLANAWIMEGWGLPIIEWTNAQDFPKKKEPHFEFIENELNIFPEPGDLMIFKSPDGVGHISIYVKYIHKNLFTSFDQNYPLGSVCKLVNHNYQNVLGWMRPKGDSMPTQGIVYDDIEGFGGPVDFSNEEHVKKFVDEYQEERNRLKNEKSKTQDLQSQLDIYKSEYEKEMKDIKARMAGFEESAKQYKAQYKEYLAKVANKLGTTQDEPAQMAELARLIVVEDELVKVEKRANFAEEELDNAKHTISELNETIKDYKEKLKVAKGLKQATNDELIKELIQKNIDFILETLKTLTNIVRRSQ